MRLWELEFLENYRCALSGVCCSDQWFLPITAKEAEQLRKIASRHPQRFPSGQISCEIEEPPHVGHFLIHHGVRHCPAFEHDGQCFIHRTEGPQAMPRICRVFPRSRMVTPRGLSQRLTPACTEVSRRIVRGGGRVAITVSEHSDKLPQEAEMTLGGESTPPVFGGNCLSWRELWDLEEHWVELCADSGLTAEEVLVQVGISLQVPDNPAQRHGFVHAVHEITRGNARKSLASIPTDPRGHCRVMSEILWRMALNTRTEGLAERSRALRGLIARLSGSAEELAQIDPERLLAARDRHLVPTASHMAGIERRYLATYLFANPDMFRAGTDACEIFARICVQLALVRLIALGHALEEGRPVGDTALQRAIQFVSVHVAHDGALWRELFGKERSARQLVPVGLQVLRC